MQDLLFQAQDSLDAVPRGTVTFLFTDIEGSTKLLEKLKEKYADLLAEQRDLLRECFSSWNGHEIDTQGDSFFVVFPRALDAVHCIIEAQQALAAHQWPAGVTVRVRMGLHTGEPIVGRTGYVGMDVHRAARIAAAGHGGQILLSQTTRDLVYQDLPSGTSLRDLGSYKLKDIRFPQQIFQLEIDGQPDNFPPLRTLASEEEPPTPGEPPFKGLHFFDEKDAHLFFGRLQVIKRLVDTISDRRFLAIIGASGSGKSSVVRAGLIPVLKKSRPNLWQIFVLTPTAHPLEALALAMTHAEQSLTTTATLQDDLRSEPRSLHYYARKSANLADKIILIVIDQFEELFTLCKDRVEKQTFINALLTASAIPDGPVRVLISLRADFYDHLAEYAQLRDAVARNQEYLGAMSADELRQAIEEPAKLGGWEFSPGLVELMLHEVGAEKGRQPEPGALPLLSHALLETWKHRRGNLMNLKAYAESGGVRKAIALTAENLYTQELTPAQQKIARNVFLRLTELGEGTQDTRRRATMSELFPPAGFADPKDVEEVLVKLADARLIITGEGTAEVAHEALIREWPTLREWLTQDRDGLRLQRHLTAAAQEWQLLDHDPGILYRGVKLVQALEWAGANLHQTNEREQEFLMASRAAAEQEEIEKEAQRQRELEAAQKLAETERARAEAERFRAEEQVRSAVRLRHRAIYLGLALIFAVMMIAVAVLNARQSAGNARLANQNQIAAELASTRAVVQQATAEAASAIAISEANFRATAEAQAVQQAQLALARELALAASANLQIDPDRSLLLAMEAYKTADIPETKAVLHEVVQKSRLRDTLDTGEGEIYGVSFSPDGKSFAIGNSDGLITIWALDASNLQVSSKPILTIQNSIDIPASLPTGYTLRYSRDGSLLAAISEKKTAKIWDASSGKLFKSLTGSGGDFFSVAFSPDSRFLVTGSSEKTITVWDVATGEALDTLTASTAGVPVVIFNLQGTQLASGGEDGSAIIWNVLPTPDNKITLSEAYTVTQISQGGYASSIAFSSDGKRLALSVNATEIKLYDIEMSFGTTTPKLLTSIAAHEETIDGIYFWGNERTVSCSLDGKAAVWDTENGRELLSLAGNAGMVISCAVNEAGVLLTGNQKGSVKVWDITDQASREWFTTSGSMSALWGRLSQDGKQLLIMTYGMNEAIIQVWDLEQNGVSLSDKKPVTIPMTFYPFLPATTPDLSRVGGIVYDPNTGVGRVQVWEMNTGQLVNRFVIYKSQKSITGACIFEPDLDCAYFLAFTPDGNRIVTGSNNGTATLWALETGEAIRSFAGHQDAIRGVEISQDGAMLATGSWDNTIRIWDINSGVLLKELVGHTGGIVYAAFSPDGKYLFSTSYDKTGKVWDLESGQPVLMFPEKANRYFMMGTFSQDGKYLAAGSWASEARVWDAETGQEIFSFIGSIVLFARDSKSLITFDGQGVVRGYYLDMDRVMQLARSRLTRTWTEEECKEFLHSETCPEPP